MWLTLVQLSGTFTEHVKLKLDVIAIGSTSGQWEACGFSTNSLSSEKATLSSVFLAKK